MGLEYVNPHRLPSPGSVFLGGAVVGLASFLSAVLLMAFVGFTLNAPIKIVISVGAATIVAPALYLFARYRARIATYQRAAIVGAGYGAGCGTSLALFLPPPQIVALLVIAIGATFIAILAIPAWFFVNHLRGPVLLNDGQTCPACGYCLIGCETMSCTECGRHFSFDELGTTETEFMLRKARPRDD